MVRQVAAAGHEVWAFTRRAEARPDLPVARVWQGDIRDRAALEPALAGVDGVCHLAALTRGRESVDRPEAHWEVNHGGMAALLDALAGQPGRTRVVFGSTAAVYGAQRRRPIDESTPPAPGNPYGASKLAAEELLRERAAKDEVEAVVLRCFNAAGTGDVDEARIIPKALAVAAGGTRGWS